MWLTFLFHCPQYKIEYEQLIEKTLAVSVWHNDIFGQNVFLGEAQVVIANYLDSGYSLDDPTPQQYQLAERVRFFIVLNCIA